MKRKSFNDPFKGGKGCYHLSSSHLEKQTVFRNDYDFIFGVNSLALLLTLFDVRLIAYCLMDNHLHLLLSDRLEACLGYYDRTVRRIAQYTAGEYGISGILSCEDVDIVTVTNDQQLKKEICYIHRNPYKARISSPLAYRWCSADVYFNNFIQSGKKAGSISVRERRRVFKTHIPVPEEHRLLSYLSVLCRVPPASYTEGFHALLFRSSP